MRPRPTGRAATVARIRAARKMALDATSWLDPKRGAIDLGSAANCLDYAIADLQAARSDIVLAADAQGLVEVSGGSENITGPGDPW